MKTHFKEAGKYGGNSYKSGKARGDGGESVPMLRLEQTGRGPDPEKNRVELRLITHVGELTALDHPGWLPLVIEESSADYSHGANLTPLGKRRTEPPITFQD
ncbi:hypothetical protein CR513_45863, partial [Mucuna pruriens]